MTSALLIERLPKFGSCFLTVPVLALTATATPEVVKDIQTKLGFREKQSVFRMSLNERIGLYCPSLQKANRKSYYIF